VPISDAIISATANTKSLCLISATSFPHTSLAIMILSNEAGKGPVTSVHPAAERASLLLGNVGLENGEEPGCKSPGSS
jgi:hypothetical protein